MQQRVNWWVLRSRSYKKKDYFQRDIFYEITGIVARLATWYNEQYCFSNTQKVSPVKHYIPTISDKQTSKYG